MNSRYSTCNYGVLTSLIEWVKLVHAIENILLKVSDVAQLHIMTVASKCIFRPVHTGPIISLKYIG